MKPNEKGNAGNIALNTLTNRLTNKPHSQEKRFVMTDNTPTRNNFQFNSRRELLESTKLSRLPERKPFTMPESSVSNAAAGCVNCGGRLEPDDAIQQSVKVCRKCLVQYAVIDGAIEAASKRKRQAMLERLAPEVNER